MSERASATFALPAAGTGAVRCTACGNRACESIGALPGVYRVECDAGGGAVRVEFDAARVTEDDLSAAMHQLGLELEKSVRHTAWRVTGLD